LEFKPPKRAQEHTTYTAGWLVERYGSYERIAQELYKEQHVQTAGISLARWFRDRNTPPHIAVALAKLVDEPSLVGILCPFLAEYLTEEARA